MECRAYSWQDRPWPQTRSASGQTLISLESFRPPLARTRPRSSRSTITGRRCPGARLEDVTTQELNDAYDAGYRAAKRDAELDEAELRHLYVEDSLTRSALKALAWRLFSTTATLSLAMFVFKDQLDLSKALKLGILDFTVKLLVYFVHERLWAQVKMQ